MCVGTSTGNANVALDLEVDWLLPCGHADAMDVGLRKCQWLCDRNDACKTFVTFVNGVTNQPHCCLVGSECTRETGSVMHINAGGGGPHALGLDSGIDMRHPRIYVKDNSTAAGADTPHITMVTDPPMRDHSNMTVSVLYNIM